MIYRAPERATKTRSRAVTHELAALLVGMSLLAAVILQFACAGAGGVAGRWLCINNARLAALKTATATPAATAGGRSAGILPVGVATPLSPAFPSTPSIVAPGTDAGAPFSLRTPSTGLDDGGDSNPILGKPTVERPNPFAASDLFADRSATMTAQTSEIFAEVTARASRRATPDLAAATEVIPDSTPDASPSTTPTPGPGTPSVTPGPSPTSTATSTRTGYP